MKDKHIKSGLFSLTGIMIFKIHNCVINKCDNWEKLFNFLGASKNADYDCWLGLLQLTDLLYVDEPSLLWWITEMGKISLKI